MPGSRATRTCRIVEELATTLPESTAKSGLAHVRGAHYTSRDLCIIIGHHKATSRTYLHGPYQAARFEAGGAGARSIRPLIFLHAICDMGISQEESHGVLDHSRAECSMRSCRYNPFPRHSRSTVRGPCSPTHLEEMAFPGSQRLAGGALSGRLCLPRSQR
jgi:hypothetical protein